MGFEGLLAGKELGGKVFVSLAKVSSGSHTWLYTISYHFHLALARVSDREWVCIFNACSRILQCKESLVWTLCRLVLGSSQADLQCVTCAYGDD